MDLTYIYYEEYNYIYSHIIMYLFNLFINTDIFPDILKTWKVIVIYKKHNRCIYSNYRPISITSQFSKIFEKLI